MVILGHAIIVFPINLHKTYWCEFIFNAVSSVHMTMFIIVSGICSVCYFSIPVFFFFFEKITKLPFDLS